MTSVNRSGSIVNLGRPFLKLGYANNVWDMQIFNERIYFGHGNSSNIGPNSQAGPVPLRYLDLKTEQFGCDTVSNSTSTHTDEEQIDRYCIINGQLIVPGHDARKEEWALGNFYRLEGETWKKYRTIPNGIHVYDMVEFNGRLFAAVGTDVIGLVLSSTDNGLTWTPISGVVSSKRIYTFIKVGEKLYAVGTLYSNKAAYIIEVDAKINAKLVSKTSASLLPFVSQEKAIKLDRNINFKEKSLFIYGEEYNDHQIIPHGLAVAEGSLYNTRRVKLPDGFAPRDLIVRDEVIYLLSSKKNASDDWIIRVYKSIDAVIWTEEFSFNYGTYALSFEEYNGTFYFGLGTDCDCVSSLCGNILKYTIPTVG